MGSYYISGLLSIIVLLVIAVSVGKIATGNRLGILIDSRGRFSLTHFQTVLWTIIILSNLIAVFVASGFDHTSLVLPETLLGLMGISAGSAVLGTGVKATKDASLSNNVWRRGCKRKPLPTAAIPAPEKETDEFSARLSQIWLEEEGELADRTISISASS
jgi:hypothetical protein